MSIAIVIYFAVEVCLRIFAIGPKDYFRNIYEVIDFVVISLSVIFEFAFSAAR